MWIHENNSWPNFTWNIDELSTKLAELRHKQGRLLGRMEHLGFEFKAEASLNTITSDIVKSSAIEGENLNTEEVRSSIARRLGIDIVGFIPAIRDVEGIVEMMLDATQNHSEPLTKERLFDWHAALFSTGRSGMHKIIVGAWRNQQAGPMQVVSGPVGKEKIHFEAPLANRLEKEMKILFKRFEKKNDIAPVLKAGIVHFWFVTIHPFEDGNGRIARAIGDMALARADNVKERFYSLSFQVEKERKTYYEKLETQQRGTTDLTVWLEWFLNCLDKAIFKAEIILEKVLYKSELWNFIKQKPINERQSKVINRMLENNFEGFMNTSKYAKLTKCSKDTALRDIQELRDREIFIQNSGKGRSTSYRLTDLTAK